MNKKQSEASATTFVADCKRSYVPPRFVAIPVEEQRLICTSVNVHKQGGQNKDEGFEEDEETDGGGFDF